MVNSGENTRSSCPPELMKSAMTRFTDGAKSFSWVEPSPARFTTATRDTGSSIPRLSSLPTPPPVQPIFFSSWLPTLESGIRVSFSFPPTTYNTIQLHSSTSISTSFTRSHLIILYSVFKKTRTPLQYVNINNVHTITSNYFIQCVQKNQALVIFSNSSDKPGLTLTIFGTENRHLISHIGSLQVCDIS